MQLLLPSSARFNVGGSIPQDLVPLDEKLQYPFAASGLSFPTLPETTAGRAIKIWSDPLPAGDGWALLRAHDGELQMRWDVALLPQVAAWMNFGAWAADGGHHITTLAWNPALARRDSLNDAVNLYKLFATIQPHASKTWWLEIELTV